MVTRFEWGYLINRDRGNPFNPSEMLRRTVMKRTLIYTAVIAALLPVMVSVANAADQD